MKSTHVPVRQGRNQTGARNDGAPLSQGEVARGLCQLPPFQDVAIKVLQISSQEDLDLRKLAKLLSADPAFSADLLRVANSSLFALRADVETVLQAATLLGLETLKAMSLTVAARSYFGDTLTRAHVRRCWTHSLVSAILAQTMGPQWGVPGDQAYTAAIVHDIGRLGLVKAYAPLYEPLLEKRFETVGENLLNETAMLGMTHCAAAGALMRAWSFPERAIVASESHHSVDHGEGMVALVRAACLCAEYLGYGEIACRRQLTADDLVDALPEGAGQRIVDRAEPLLLLVRERLMSVTAG